MNKTLFDSDGLDHDDVIRSIRHRVDDWRGFPLGPASQAYPREGVYEPKLTDERPLTATSRELLRHWFPQWAHEVGVGDESRLFKYWPHQRRAVETFIYLHEVCGVRRAEELWSLVGPSPEWSQRDPWPKLGAQLATGSGKTKVMSLLIAWAYLNAVREDASPLGLGPHILVIAPGLFVRDRLLQDFLPGEDGGRSVFVADPLVPPSMEGDWNLNVYNPDTCPRVLDPHKGALVVTNFHQLLRKGELSKATLPSGPRQISLLFEEAEPSKLESVDVPLIDRFRRSRGVLVLNDEAHHVWDETGHQQFEEKAKAVGAKLEESEEQAMAWIRAIRRLHGTSTANGKVGLQVDLSATLFEERAGLKKKSTGKSKTVAVAARPSLFRHAAMRYDLAEARNENIVKRPALENVRATKVGSGESQPLIDDGAPNAWEKYRHLLAAGIQRWVEVRNTSAGSVARTPLLFIVCGDKGEAAEVANYLRYGQASRENLSGQPVHGYEDPKTKEVLFRHVRSDGVPESTVLEVHIGSKEQSNEKDWEKVRASVNSVDREKVPDPTGALDAFGHPVMVPNPIEVVVSVMMLKEGWDVRNVAVIVPLRPCDSRTLTEQILGRGLRKVHPPEIAEDGAAELLQERLYVIEHPSFAAVIEEIKDIVEQTNPDEPSPPPEYVLVEPRAEDAEAHDVRMVKYEGQMEIVREWHDDVVVSALPALATRRPWRGTFDETEINTTLQEAQLAGKEFGLSFVLPSKPTYRDFDHVLEAVYVLPLLKKLQKSRQHLNAVKSVVREYLEQRTFDTPAGMPLSFEKSVEQGSARLAMANLARRDVSERVIDALQPILKEAMEKRLPSTQALISVKHSSEVEPYSARKTNVYPAPKLSAFNCAPMDSADEVRVAALLDQCTDVEGWIFNHRKVAYFIEYDWNGRVAKYIPDFVVRAKIGKVEHNVLIEVKGRFDDQDKRKAQRGLAYARQLTEADGRPWHYVFLLENPPNKRKDITWWSQQSVTRVEDLLRRHESLPLYPTNKAAPLALLAAETVPAEDRFTRALPIYDLVAAAGGWGASQEPTIVGWLPLTTDVPFERDCFVARMEGASMQRPDGDGVPNGAWVMFRRWNSGAPPLRALDGRRLLVQWRSADDPEAGGRYTVKRLRVTSLFEDGGTASIELRSDNPEFPPIAVTPGDGNLDVVAELVRVLA